MCIPVYGPQVVAAAQSLSLYPSSKVCKENLEVFSDMWLELFNDVATLAKDIVGSSCAAAAAAAATASAAASAAAAAAEFPYGYYGATSFLKPFSTRPHHQLGPPVLGPHLPPGQIPPFGPQGPLIAVPPQVPPPQVPLSMPVMPSSQHCPPPPPQAAPPPPPPPLGSMTGPGGEVAVGVPPPSILSPSSQLAHKPQGPPVGPPIGPQQMPQPTQVASGSSSSDAGPDDTKGVPEAAAAAEAQKWQEAQEESEIARRAKSMSQMSLSMYEFTRGEGELKTTQDLFTQAEFFAEEANKLYKIVRHFTYQVSNTSMIPITLRGDRSLSC